MELQLRSAQELAEQQERNIQNLTDSVNSKETEVRGCVMEMTRRSYRGKGNV